MSNERAHIKAISYYLPPDVFGNSDFLKEFPDLESNAHLDKTGVSERRIVGNVVTSSDLGVEACKNLFKEHNIQPSDIDFIIYCSLEFDYIFPGTSVVLHKQLGFSVRCGALDLAVGCSGYPYALSFAKGLIETSGYKNVLIVNASTLSKRIHPKDKASRYLFGDAAAATLVSARKDKQGIGEFIFGTESKKLEQIIIKDGAARNPLNDESYVDFSDENGNVTNNAHVYMNGFSVFNFGLKVVPEMITELLAKNKLNRDAIDVFIFHQANLFMIDTIQKKIGIPEEKVFNFIEKVGNTVSASIPIALYEAQKAGKVKPGSKVVLAAFGVGLSWGATIIDL